MEKEQKKLLLVAVSVGVFLLVTITAAIAVMTPKINSAEPVLASQPILSGNVQSSNNIVPIQQIETPEINVKTENVNINIENENAKAVTAANIPEEKKSGDIVTEDSLIINVPRPTTAAVPDTPAEPAARIVSAPSSQKTQSQVKPSSSVRSTTVKPSAPANKARTQTAAKPVPVKTINDYWIQVGAFSSVVRAEDAKELLADKGLVSIIETREVNGRSLYRVRLGPYTSKDEAGFWLTLVNSVDTFGKSSTPPYVSQTVRTN